jgi:hypothetical protein
VRCGHPIPIDPSSRRIRLGWGIGRHRMNEPTRPTYPKWVILLSGALSGAAAILYVGLILPGVGLHFWTVSMAYHVEGIGPAILALLFPIGAELFLGVQGVARVRIRKHIHARCHHLWRTLSTNGGIVRYC